MDGGGPEADGGVLDAGADVDGGEALPDEQPDNRRPTPTVAVKKNPRFAIICLLLPASGTTWRVGHSSSVQYRQIGSLL